MSLSWHRLCCPYAFICHSHVLYDLTETGILIRIPEDSVLMTIVG